MERCPLCNTKVNTGDTSGFLANKIVFLSPDIVEQINHKLPPDMRSEKICSYCINYNSFIGNGICDRVQRRINSLKSGNPVVTNTGKEEIELKILNESKKFVKCFTIEVKEFTPVESIDSVVMFDSGARSTSADNFNAGIWNVINDSLTLKLGNTKNVEDAIEAAKNDLKYKTALLGCNTIVGLRSTYSDLASNGKILLHLSGTAGYIGEMELNPELKKLMADLEKDETDIDPKDLQLKHLEDLMLDLKNERFFSN